MEEIMREVGMSDGFLVPSANDENIALLHEVQKLQINREKHVLALEDKTSRLKLLRNHLLNVESEQNENAKIIFEFQCQIQVENTSISLYEGQIRSSVAEERDLDKSIQEQENRKENYKNESFKVSSRLEENRAQLQWDQSALEIWTAAAIRVGDDHARIEEYSQEDQAKFEHLDLKRMQLRQEVGRKQRKFENINGDILSLEQSLEKLANDFHSQQNDRQALIDQWHGTSRVLHQRDEEISRLMEEIGEIRAQAKLRLSELNEHKNFFLNEQKNNKETEMDVAHFEQESQQTAATCRELEATVSDLTGHLSIVRSSLTSAARQVQALRNHCRRMNEDIYNKMLEIQQLEDIIQSLNVQIQESSLKKISAIDRAQQLEKLKSEEEVNLERLTVENDKLQEKVRLVSEELSRLRRAEREQRAMMNSLEATSQGLRQRTAVALAEQKRQEEILYRAEMSFLEKDLAYKRMLGRADPESAERSANKLMKLEETLANVKKTQQFIQKECYRLEQEYRRVLSTLERDEREHKFMRIQRQELILQAEGGTKRISLLKSSNQEKQVEENTIRLRVCHLEKALKRVGGQLFSLEKQKLELEEVVKERAMEVEAVLEILSIKKRALSEQLSHLNLKINEAQLKVQHLEAKHAVSMQSLGLTEMGEVMSVTQLKIMAAQERCELQERGDKLDAKIRTVEREITAMENTLKAVNAANTTYKSSLSRVPVDGSELEEKSNLEGAYVKAVEKLRGKRAALQELEEAATQLRDGLQVRLEEEANLLKEAANRASDVSDVERRIDALTEKQNRATRELKSLLKQLHLVQKTEYQSLEEKDVILRELRDQNQSALQQLGEVAACVIETAPVINQYLRERGLTLPQPSTRRSTTSSRASSIVASSSRLTIDAQSLGERKPAEIKTRRPSILKSERKLQQSKAGEGIPSIDIVDLVVPQKK